MKLTVIRLWLNDTLMPAPKIDGVDFSTEPIWSKNAGRNGRTLMVGTVISKKRTLNIKWPPLTESQVALIEDNLSSPGRPWIKVTLEMDDSTVMSFEAYSGTPKSKGWNALGGVWRRSGMQVSIIER